MSNRHRALQHSADASLRIRKIAVVAAADAYPGYVTTALDVLQIANVRVRGRVQQVIPGAARRRSVISHSILSLDGKPVRLMGKVLIEADESVLDSTQQFDAVVVPALIRRSHGSLAERLQGLRNLYPWLRRQQSRGAMLVAGYTGVFILAEAGLLDDHSAAVSIELAAQFASRYPRVRIDSSRPLIDDHERVTAAGLAGHIEALWRIVNRFRSGIIAQRTAQDLALQAAPADAERTGPVIAANPLIERAQHLICDNISARLNLRAVARTLSISERTLFRRFKAVVGTTPNAYLQQVRIASAKSSLELTGDSIATIAACAGYADRAFFSRIFREYTGMTPTAFRARARRVQPNARRRQTRVVV